MSDNVVPHPYSDLVAEAKRERELADSPEGLALKEAIFEAVKAYSRFLERQGLIWEFSADLDALPRLKADALVVTHAYADCSGEYIDITLKNGALDRVYGNGVNPDPGERGPSDIPHKRRSDD